MFAAPGQFDCPVEEWKYRVRSGFEGTAQGSEAATESPVWKLLLVAAAGTLGTFAPARMRKAFFAVYFLTVASVLAITLWKAHRTRRIRSWKSLAWRAIADHDPFLAHAALLELPPGSIDLHLLAAYLGCCNRLEEAIELLDDARSRGQRSREVTKLHIDLLFRSDRQDAALRIASEDRSFLSLQDRSDIARAGTRQPVDRPT